MSMLKYTYTHKPLREIQWPYAVTRLTVHFMRGRMSDIMVAKKDKNIIWLQMAANVLVETGCH